MTAKSYVSMERRICIVCGAEYDTNALIIDRRLRASLEKYTTTGWGLCSEDQQRFNDGFVALVEIDPAKSGNPPEGGNVRPERAYRTGPIAYLKRDALAQMFHGPIPQRLPYVFVEPGLIQKLQAMTQSSKDRADAN